MKVLLLELQEGVAKRSFNSIMPPVLAVWAEREGWEAEVTFSSPERFDCDRVDADVVGISSYTFLAEPSYRVAAELRSRGKLVVFGGPHAKGRVDEIRGHADAVFTHCDEDAWRGFLRGVEQGSVKPSAPGVFFPSKELARLPAYREYAGHYGSKVPLLISSLGCPYTCGFCADWDSTYQKRSVADVLADVRDLRRRLFVFIDPNFGVNPEFTSELLRGMVGLGKRYIMQTNLALLRQDDYLALLRDSGCVGIQIGIESLGNKFAKNDVRRSESVADETIRRIRHIKRFIPFVQANFIFGLDEDDSSSFDSVLDLYQRSEIDTIVPHIATPFPGTPLYDDMYRGGRIFDHDTRNYDGQNLVITLESMTPQRFYDGYIDVHRRLYGVRTILRKTLQHARKRRSLISTAFLFAFLVRRGSRTLWVDVPRYRRRQERLVKGGVYPPAALSL